MRFVFCICLMLLPLPALAQEACPAPPEPATVNGATATADQLRAAMAEVRSFMAQSSLFQDCLDHEIDAAHLNGIADPAADAAAKARIAASQKAQEKAADMINLAVTLYKQAHPY